MRQLLCTLSLLSLVVGCDNLPITQEPSPSQAGTVDAEPVLAPAPALDATQLAAHEDLEELLAQPAAEPLVPTSELVAAPLPPAAPSEPLPGAKLIQTQADPAPVTDVWQRIIDGFELDHYAHKRIVKAEINWFIKHPDYLARVSNRARPYLYFVLEQVEARQLPSELALLPIVESAYDPFAYSHGRAAGMWQFVPATGLRYGLKQNWWYDGRRDVYASTEAALSYLSDLHKMFDDWHLALASYNSGEGRVSRALKRLNKTPNESAFWHIRLPLETRTYVPKLLALAHILSNPQQYGSLFPAIDNNPYLSRVEVGSQIDLGYAAEAAGMSIEELYRLNPGFNRWATAPNGPHHLLIPITHVDRFTRALAKLPADARVTWRRYRIRNGDSLSTIAKRFATDVNLVRKVNRVRNNKIRAGDTLLVPVASRQLSEYTLSAAQRQQRIQSQPRGQIKVTHIVKSGDTLWDISRHYGVSTRSLAKWNAMAPRDPLLPGKTLVIWLGSQAKAKASSASNTPVLPQDQLRKIKYRVRKGDSLARIANKFKVEVKDIRTWNSLQGKKYIHPGQVLTLLIDITRQSGR